MNGYKAGTVRLTLSWHGENLPQNEDNSEESRVRNEERQWLTDTVSHAKKPTCDSPVLATNPSLQSLTLSTNSGTDFLTCILKNRNEARSSCALDVSTLP